VWLLDVATGGGSLLTDSREAVTLINQATPAAMPLPSAATSLSATPSLARVGVISGNEFTPLPAAALQSGTW